jgi:cell division GTPase FtsZ
MDFCLIYFQNASLKHHVPKKHFHHHNLGKEVTRGLGAGGVPDNGRKAAEESRAEIMKLVTSIDFQL